jgi:hypothetical protein
MLENPKERENRPLSTGQTWLVSTGLFLFALCVLLATLDVGYSRDEAFYFEYGESYDNWLVEVVEAEDQEERAEVLGRKQVLKTWKGNFEHPPLMKSLFGLSRRVLGVKHRSVNQLREIEDGVSARIGRLSASDGFEQGAEITLLAPLALGEPAGKKRKVLARGEVREREIGSAMAVFSAVEASALKEACKDLPGEPSVAPCQVREENTLAVLDEGTAMRFPGMVSGALVVVLTFLMGLGLFGWRVGLFAALAFLFIPRNFYHAHLACFDMPIVAATLATFYAFWRSLEDRRWALIAGIFWGVALLVKHNAFFLPAPLILCWLWFGRDELSLAWNRGRPTLRLPSLPLAFLVMPPVALTLFFVAWPRLWYDPFVALTEYFAFHLEHVHYLQWYFGEPLQVPPFPVDLPFMLTLTTVPVPLTILALVGLFVAVKPQEARLAWRRIWRKEAPTHHARATFFATMNGFFPIVLIALPSVPIFGGVKHWMTAMPFLMILAGFGFFRLVDAMLPRSKGLIKAVMVVALAAVILGAAAIESIRGLPYGPGYYNRHGAGGVRGAADAQMMRTYWGTTTHEALDWLNRSAPPNARVYFQNNPQRAIEIYKRDGKLRADIRPVRTASSASIALVEPQKSFAEAEDLGVRRAFQKPGPEWTVKYEGVNMLRVYVRDTSVLLAPSEDD